MGVMMNLIMLGCTYPIVLIMYVFMKLEIGDKKKTVLGIAVPEEFRKDPQVLEICGQFRKSMRLGLIVMLIFPAVFFWMPWFTLYITGYLIWVYLMIGVELYPMAKYGERLKELKRKRGWGRAGVQESTVDFSIAVQPVHAAKKGLLAVLCVLSVPPILWELVRQPEQDLKWAYTLILVMMASIVWLLSGMLIWLDRQKSEIISRDSDVNLEFNRRKKRMRASAWTWAAGWSVLLVWLTAFALHDRLGGMIAYTVEVAVYTVVVCWLMFRCEWGILRVRREMTTTLENYDSDETHWYFGALVYYNPNDRHAFVENRVGTGSTMNLASTGGKVMAALTVLLLIGCLIGVPILVGRDEFTPVSLFVEDGTLKSIHTGTEYEISEQDIASAVLLEELPDVSRKNGTGLPNLSKGRYKIEGHGNGYLCLNPQNKVFLMVETREGQTYLFSDATDEGTVAAYEALNGK